MDPYRNKQNAHRKEFLFSLQHIVFLQRITIDYLVMSVNISLSLRLI